MLCNTRVLLAAGLNPGDVNPSDFGITTNPAGYLTPQFTITAQNAGGGGRRRSPSPGARTKVPTPRAPSARGSTAAVTAARDAITNGMHVRLAAVFDNNIDVNAATVDNATFDTDLGQLYDDLCGLSGMGRDAPGLHTFRPAGSESWSAWSWLEWAGRKRLPTRGHDLIFGEPKDIRKLVTGPAFQVPGPLTNVLIRL